MFGFSINSSPITQRVKYQLHHLRLQVQQIDTIDLIHVIYVCLRVLLRI